jgi:hypothetical protein
MCEKDMRCIESAGGQNINTVPPAGFLNHGHGTPALAHAGSIPRWRINNEYSFPTYKSHAQIVPTEHTFPEPQ